MTPTDKYAKPASNLLKIGDLYMFMSEFDFSIWTISDIKYENQIYKVFALAVFHSSKDDIGSTINWSVYSLNGKLSGVYKVSECKDKYGAIKKVFNV